MSDVSDVLVLGAGVIGAAVAGELATRGARVRLLDPRTPGQGATQASAGMLAPHTEARTPESFAALCVEALDCYDGFVAGVRRDTDQPFEYTRCGTVEVALAADTAGHLRREADRLSGVAGLGARWVDAAELSAAEPSLSPHAAGALIVGTQGFVAVPPFLSAVVSAARRRGVRIHTGVTASAIVRGASNLRVETSHGEHTAGHVIVCAGSWSTNITVDGEPTVPVRPVRGQLLHIRPRQPLTSRILWGPRCYLVPWSDGSILVGATVEEAGYDERTTLEGVAQLTAAAIELVPSLADAALVGARVGLRPATPDGLPVIGPWRHDPRIVFATGHYRNGVLLAPITAAMVADLVIDGRAHRALSGLGPDRFVPSFASPGGGR